MTALDLAPPDPLPPEVAARFAMSNRMASAVGMVPNPASHAQGR